MIASAMAVELLISCLQHPLRHQAPSETSSSDDQIESSCLGIIPHQVREVYMPACQAFDKCTACSNKVYFIFY